MNNFNQNTGQGMQLAQPPIGNAPNDINQPINTAFEPPKPKGKPALLFVIIGIVAIALIAGLIFGLSVLLNNEDNSSNGSGGSSSAGRCGSYATIEWRGTGNPHAAKIAVPKDWEDYRTPGSMMSYVLSVESSGGGHTIYQLSPFLLANEVYLEQMTSGDNVLTDGIETRQINGYEVHFIISKSNQQEDRLYISIEVWKGNTARIGIDSTPFLSTLDEGRDKVTEIVNGICELN